MLERPEIADAVSVSLHCEFADILNAYTKIVEREGKLDGLAAYSAARPPHSEGLAIWIASYLAYETDCLNINLLHLSSKKAMDAALMRWWDCGVSGRCNVTTSLPVSKVWKST